MSNKLDKKKLISIILLIMLVIVVLILNYNKNDQEEEFIINSEDKFVEKELENEKHIIVHITGCVKNRGIIEIKENSRISDVINAAGGLTDDADISKVNLAYIVKDAQKIYIPSIWDEEEIEYISDKSGENVIVEENKQGGKIMVNINSALQTELEQLPGIGPSTALKIIEYRNQNGKFKSIEDLKEIPGIGEGKFNNIKGNIEV